MTQADCSFRYYHRRMRAAAIRTYIKLRDMNAEADPQLAKLMARAKRDAIRHDELLNSMARGVTRHTLTNDEQREVGLISSGLADFIDTNQSFDQAGFEEAMAGLDLPATPKQPVASVEQLRQWRLEEEKRQTETALADIKERRAAVKAADDEIVGFAKLRLVKKDDQ